MLMENRNLNSKPELWGGLECTINRLENTFHDQLQYTGHYQREDDIDHIAALGLKAIRYPILWELHETTFLQPIDWSWSQKQLNALRDRNITIIAGLVHHGSGPVFTNLLDPKFPELLANYALKVATKFPWLRYYTPINEPLTTARFSGLYGLWYPHQNNDKSFVRILFNQLKGIVLSMKAIRTINPEAQLVQTEDLGKAHCTESLRCQAVFENERRWLTFDLLHGRVCSQHPLWNYLLSADITESEILFFNRNPCIPDIAGWNYYVTSERFLDDRIENYPHCTPGGNGIKTYVDIEAMRVSRHSGLKILLQEAWERFGLPMAITEAHLCCTREEQMRWFMEIWNICCDAKQKGINIIAVTAWALFGSFDWGTLLTKKENIYESSVFDVHASIVRPTALANLLSSLSLKGFYYHPVLDQPGWWHGTVDYSQKSRQSLVVLNDHYTNNTLSTCCQNRKLEHTELYLNEVYDNDFEHVMNTYRPWGFIYSIDSDSKSGLTTDFENHLQALGSLAKLCFDYNISFMIISRNPENPSNIDYHLTLCSLIVLTLNPNSIIARLEDSCHLNATMNRDRSALNLIIDGNPGVWNISDEGAITSASQALFQQNGQLPIIKRHVHETLEKLKLKSKSQINRSKRAATEVVLPVHL